MRAWLCLLVAPLVTVAAAAQEQIETIFQYKNEFATNVAVVGEFTRGKPVAMARDEQSLWSIRLPLKPGQYAYKFLVNGANSVFDPLNPARKRIGKFEYSAVTVGDYVPPAPEVKEPPPVPPPPKPAKPLITIAVVPTKNTRNVGPYYYQDRAQNVQMTVTVKSREMNRQHTGLTGELYVLSRSARDNKEFQLIIRESKTFDLPVHGTVEYESKVAKLLYDEQGYKYGFKYYGYLYLLRDANNDVLLSVAVPDRLIADQEHFLDLELNQTFGM